MCGDIANPTYSVGLFRRVEQQEKLTKQENMGLSRTLQTEFCRFPLARPSSQAKFYNMKVSPETNTQKRKGRLSRTYGGAYAVMPVGVVVRVTPGITRWANWSRKVIDLLPGARDENWKVLRRDGDVVEYHAGTLSLELFESDTEAYRLGLSSRSPSLFVVMRENGDDVPELVLVTASPYEAQDYLDSGEEVVEPVVMPDGVIAWVRDFVDAHHEEEVFVKRRRDRVRTDLREDGRGDARIFQATDVYRAPRRPVHLRPVRTVH